MGPKLLGKKYLNSKRLDFPHKNEISKKSNFDPCENVKNACAVVEKAEVSQEP